MGIIEITLGLLLAVALVGAIGKWLPVPLPLLQVAAGVALSYVPAFGSLSVPPEVFFLLFIPPLLFAEAWVIPKRDLVGALRPVLLLAFGLVLFTVLAVGYLLHWLVPELPLAAAFALGAVVSPTDAVAVSAVTGKLRIPARVATIVNGESLINDASGLVAFKFATAAVVTGVFSWREAALQFLVLSGGGFVLGVALAWAIGKLRAHLVRFCIGDPTIQTVISLLTPYAAYLAAEALGLGGATYDVAQVKTETDQLKTLGNDVIEAITVAGNGEASITVGFGTAVATMTVTAPFPNQVADSVYASSPKHNSIDEHVLRKLQSLRLPPSLRGAKEWNE